MSKYFELSGGGKPCDEDCGKLKPDRARLEAVTEEGRIKMHLGGVPHSRTEEVLCFSKTVGGSIENLEELQWIQNDLDNDYILVDVN